MGTAALTGVVGSAIGAGASLIGGGATTAAQNAANKEIAQMNNEFNEKMLDKQMAYNKEMYQQQLGDQWKFYNDAKQNSWDLVENQQNYQTEMWNKTNEYNSPSAQRDRLEAAGLNPYMMLNGGSAGTAQTMSGSSGSAPTGASPSAQGVNPPTATPYSADYSGITAGLGRAIDVLASMPDRNVKNAQADNLRIEGKYIAGKAMAQILQMKTEAKTKEARLALDKLVASFGNDLKTSQMQVNDQNIAESRARVKLMTTETLLNNQKLAFLPQAQKLQLAQGTADIALKYAQKGLTEKQARHEIEKLAETVVRANGKALQNQYDAETYRDRVTSVRVALWNAVNEGLPRDLGEHFFGQKFQYDKFSDY